MAAINFSGNKVGITLLTIICLIVAALVGEAIGSSEYTLMVVTVGGILGLFFFLFLGSRYWIVIPFSLVAQLPTIPLFDRAVELPELAIAACTGIYLTRIGLGTDKLQLFRKTHIPILLFMAWVGFIYVLNPVGLAAMGSSVMGGRFYVKLVLAFSSFVILASTPISEEDAKWALWMVIIGTVINTIYSILIYVVLGGPTVDQLGMEVEVFYSWHQVLGNPAMAVAFILFGRYKPSEVFGIRHPLVLAVYGIALLLVLFSGKRMAVVAVLLAPVVGAILYREYRYIALAIIAAIIGAGIIIVGHGELFSLPKTIQRAISWLPAKWDNSIVSMEGGRDPFRESLRRYAMENISRDPIIGKGFAVNYALASAAFSSQATGGMDALAAPYAIGRSWHNTWLGYAADFGIPLSVIQASIFLTVLIIAFRTASKLPHPSFLQTFVIYLLIYTTRDVVASHTSGHTSLDAFNRWWMYGMLFSIFASVFSSGKKEKIIEKAIGSLPIQDNTAVDTR